MDDIKNLMYYNTQFIIHLQENGKLPSNLSATSMAAKCMAVRYQIKHPGEFGHFLAQNAQFQGAIQYNSAMSYMPDMLNIHGLTSKEVLPSLKTNTGMPLQEVENAYLGVANELNYLCHIGSIDEATAKNVEKGLSLRPIHTVMSSPLTKGMSQSYNDHMYALENTYKKGRRTVFDIETAGDVISEYSFQQIALPKNGEVYGKVLQNDTAFLGLTSPKAYGYLKKNLDQFSPDIRNGKVRVAATKSKDNAYAFEYLVRLSRSKHNLEFNSTNGTWHLKSGMALSPKDEAITGTLQEAREGLDLLKSMGDKMLAMDKVPMMVRGQTYNVFPFEKAFLQPIVDSYTQSLTLEGHNILAFDIPAIANFFTNPIFASGSEATQLWQEQIAPMLNAIPKTDTFDLLKSKPSIVTELISNAPEDAIGKIEANNIGWTTAEALELATGVANTAQHTAENDTIAQAAFMPQISAFNPKSSDYIFKHLDPTYTDSEIRQGSLMFIENGTLPNKGQGVIGISTDQDGIMHFLNSKNALSFSANGPAFNSNAYEAWLPVNNLLRVDSINALSPNEETSANIQKMIALDPVLSTVNPNDLRVVNMSYPSDINGISNVHQFNSYTLIGTDATIANAFGSMRHIGDIQNDGRLVGTPQSPASLIASYIRTSNRKAATKASDKILRPGFFNAKSFLHFKTLIDQDLAANNLKRYSRQAIANAAENVYNAIINSSGKEFAQYMQTFGEENSQYFLRNMHTNLAMAPVWYKHADILDQAVQSVAKLAIDNKITNGTALNSMFSSYITGIRKGVLMKTGMSDDEFLLKNKAGFITAAPHENDIWYEDISSLIPNKTIKTTLSNNNIHLKFKLGEDFNYAALSAFQKVTGIEDKTEAAKKLASYMDQKYRLGLGDVPNSSTGAMERLVSALTNRRAQEQKAFDKYKKNAVEHKISFKDGEAQYIYSKAINGAMPTPFIPYADRSEPYLEQLKKWIPESQQQILQNALDAASASGNKKNEYIRFGDKSNVTSIIDKLSNQIFFKDTAHITADDLIKSGYNNLAANYMIYMRNRRQEEVKNLLGQIIQSTLGQRLYSQESFGLNIDVANRMATLVGGGKEIELTKFIPIDSFDATTNRFAPTLNHQLLATKGAVYLSNILDNGEIQVPQMHFGSAYGNIFHNAASRINYTSTRYKSAEDVMHSIKAALSDSSDQLRQHLMLVNNSVTDVKTGFHVMYGDLYKALPYMIQQNYLDTTDKPKLASILKKIAISKTPANKNFGLTVLEQAHLATSLPYIFNNVLNNPMAVNDFGLSQTEMTMLKQTLASVSTAQDKHPEQKEWSLTVGPNFSPLSDLGSDTRGVKNVIGRSMPFKKEIDDSAVLQQLRQNSGIVGLQPGLIDSSEFVEQGISKPIKGIRGISLNMSQSDFQSLVDSKEFHEYIANNYKDIEPDAIAKLQNIYITESGSVSSPHLLKYFNRHSIEYINLADLASLQQLSNAMASGNQELIEQTLHNRATMMPIISLSYKNGQKTANIDFSNVKPRYFGINDVIDKVATYNGNIIDILSHKDAYGQLQFFNTQARQYLNEQQIKDILNSAKNLEAIEKSIVGVASKAEKEAKASQKALEILKLNNIVARIVLHPAQISNARKIVQDTEKSFSSFLMTNFGSSKTIQDMIKDSPLAELKGYSFSDDFIEHLTNENYWDWQPIKHHNVTVRNMIESAMHYNSMNDMHEAAQWLQTQMAKEGTQLWDAFNGFLRLKGIIAKDESVATISNHLSEMIKSSHGEIAGLTGVLLNTEIYNKAIEMQRQNPKLSYNQARGLAARSVAKTLNAENAFDVKVRAVKGGIIDIGKASKINIKFFTKLAGKYNTDWSKTVYINLSNGKKQAINVAKSVSDIFSPRDIDDKNNQKQIMLNARTSTAAQHYIFTREGIDKLKNQWELLGVPKHDIEKILGYAQPSNLVLEHFMHMYNQLLDTRGNAFATYDYEKSIEFTDEEYHNLSKGQKERYTKFTSYTDENENTVWEGKRRATMRDEGYSKMLFINGELQQKAADELYAKGMPTYMIDILKALMHSYDANAPFSDIILNQNLSAYRAEQYYANISGRRTAQLQEDLLGLSPAEQQTKIKSYMMKHHSGEVQMANIQTIDFNKNIKDAEGRLIKPAQKETILDLGANPSLWYKKDEEHAAQRYIVMPYMQAIKQYGAQTEFETAANEVTKAAQTIQHYVKEYYSTPANNDNPTLEKNLQRRLHNAIGNYFYVLNNYETSKQGLAAHINEVEMPASGSYKIHIHHIGDNALTRKAIINESRQLTIAERLSHGMNTAAIWVSKDAARKMLFDNDHVSKIAKVLGLSREEFSEASILENMTRHGAAAINARYPLNYEGSLSTPALFVDENLSGLEAHATDVIMRAANADNDGDMVIAGIHKGTYNIIRYEDDGRISGRIKNVALAAPEVRMLLEHSRSHKFTLEAIDKNASDALSFFNKSVAASDYILLNNRQTLNAKLSKKESLNSAELSQAMKDIFTSATFNGSTIISNKAGLELGHSENIRYAFSQFIHSSLFQKSVKNAGQSMEQMEYWNSDAWRSIIQPLYENHRIQQGSDLDKALQWRSVFYRAQDEMQKGLSKASTGMADYSTQFIKNMMEHVNHIRRDNIQQLLTSGTSDGIAEAEEAARLMEQRSRTTVTLLSDISDFFQASKNRMATDADGNPVELIQTFHDAVRQLMRGDTQPLEDVVFNTMDILKNGKKINELDLPDGADLRTVITDSIRHILPENYVVLNKLATAKYRTGTANPESTSQVANKFAGLTTMGQGTAEISNKILEASGDADMQWDTTSPLREIHNPLIDSDIDVEKIGKEKDKIYEQLEQQLPEDATNHVIKEAKMSEAAISTLDSMRHAIAGRKGAIGLGLAAAIMGLGFIGGNPTEPPNGQAQGISSNDASYEIPDMSAQYAAGAPGAQPSSPAYFINVNASSSAGQDNLNSIIQQAFKNVGTTNMGSAPKMNLTMNVNNSASNISSRDLANYISTLF